MTYSNIADFDSYLRQFVKSQPTLYKEAQRRNLCEYNPCCNLHIYGMVADEKRDNIYRLLPNNATYYFTKPLLPRALNENIRASELAEYSLKGKIYPNVWKSLSAARKNAYSKDFIYVGGSTFVVADIL